MTRARPILRIAAVAILATWVLSCANVLFERGPYAIRSVEVVYSTQEDMTFFFWKIRRDADPRRVAFELWEDGHWWTIDVEDTAYAAKPFECGEHFLCYQFQVEGEYELPDDFIPLRSIHPREGVLVGSDALYQQVTTTLRFSPIPLNGNQEIDPVLSDHFQERGYDFRRSFEWRLLSRLEEDCQGGLTPFAPLGTGMISVDREWTQRASCLVVRPVHRQDKGFELVAPIDPTPVTNAQVQTYTPERILATTTFQIALDLEIPNASRCEQITNWLIDTITREFSARGNAELVGVYRPLDRVTSEELSGCAQDAGRVFPLDRIVADANLAAGRQPHPTRDLLIYVNNIELIPDIESLLPLRFDGESVLITERPSFLVALASNSVISSFFWDWSIGWRPIEDPTFAADIRTFARAVLPFSTMKHDTSTRITVERPAGSRRPRYLKICSFVPEQYWVLRTEDPSAVHEFDSAYAEWPRVDLPYLNVGLGRQNLVEFHQYERVSVSFVVETCDEFCDFAFRTQNDVVYPSWLRPAVFSNMSHCRWTP